MKTLITLLAGLLVSASTTVLAGDNTLSAIEQQQGWESLFDGKSLKFFFHPIKKIINSTKSNSLIDFGCGKAKYYFENVKIDNITYNNIADFWKIQKYFLYDQLISFSLVWVYRTFRVDDVRC